MKSRKAWTVMLSIVMIASLVLAGCGKSGGNSSNPQSSADGDNNSATPAQSGQPSQAPAEEPVTLKIVSTTILEKPESTVEQQIADDFMKLHPNVKIEFIGVPMNDLNAKLTTMATGNNLPDIFTNTPEYMSHFDEMGIVEDLKPLLGDDFLAGYYKSNADAASLDGRMLFSPWFSTPMGLLYRADWFQEKNLKAPETWDDFLVDAKALTEDGKRWGFAMVGSKNGSGESRFIHILRTFGADELREDNGKWVTDIGSPESVQAFQFFTDLFTKDGVVPPGPTQVSYAEAVTEMATEKTAMMITGPHTTGAIYAQNPDLKGKLGSVPIPKSSGPKGKHITTLGLLGFSVSSKSEHKDVAAEYLKFMINKENQVKFNEVTGRMPTRQDAGDAVTSSGDTFKGFIQALDYQVTLPTVPYYAKVQDALGEAYQNVLTGQASVGNAVKKAQQTIQTTIADQ